MYTEHIAVANLIEVNLFAAAVDKSSAGLEDDSCVESSDRGSRGAENF